MTLLEHETTQFPQPPPVPVRQFTVAEYQRMVETGLLGEDDHVELLEGWIVPKMVRNPRHDYSVAAVTELLIDRRPRGWHVRSQCAVTTDKSQPEPDAALMRGPGRKYAARHPHRSEIELVVEVADSSLQRDRQIKSPIYAQAGIPIYWIINLIDNCVEVRTDPKSTGAASQYTKQTDYFAGQSVPLIVAGKKVATIAVNDLLP